MTAPARAASDLSSCRALAADSTRLACYDKLSGAPTADAVPSWSGTGNQNMPPFTVDGPWTLHWSSGATMGISVQTDPNSDIPNDMASSIGGGASSSYETVTGTIYLKIITAMGPWKIWVTPAN